MATRRALFPWLAALVPLAAIAAAATAAPGASGGPGPGPAIGEPFGTKLELADQRGTTRTLAGLHGARGATIVFVRSADWCPFCRKQLAELNARASAFAEAGFPLVSVSVDEVDDIAKFASAANIDFTMLADPRSESIDALGIRDPSYPTGSRAAGVPRPVIFVVDRDGVVRGKRYVEGFRDRPDPDAVLADVRELAAM